MTPSSYAPVELALFENNDDTGERGGVLSVAESQPPSEKSNFHGVGQNEIVEPLCVRPSGKQEDSEFSFHSSLNPLSHLPTVGRIAKHSLAPPLTE